MIIILTSTTLLFLVIYLYLFSEWKEYDKRINELETKVRDISAKFDATVKYYDSKLNLKKLDKSLEELIKEVDKEFEMMDLSKEVEKDAEYKGKLNVQIGDNSETVTEEKIPDTNLVVASTVKKTAKKIPSKKRRASKKK